MFNNPLAFVDPSGFEPHTGEKTKFDVRCKSFEIAVGCGDHANIHLNIAHAADAPEDLVVQNAQKLCLKQRGEFANFIQKQRSTVSHFEQAFLHRLSVGERAALMAKQLRLHQRFRNRGAIDGHKRLVFARALIMNRLGHQVLAGSAFALDQNCASFAGRDFLDELHQLGHFSRHANHVVIAGAPAHFSAQGFHFRAQRARFQGVLQRYAKLFVIDGLADEVVRAQTTRSASYAALPLRRRPPRSGSRILRISSRAPSAPAFRRPRSRLSFAP